ncbi:unnamed protein product, partial [marine sediment metagenome]
NAPKNGIIVLGYKWLCIASVLVTTSPHLEGC